MNNNFKKVLVLVSNDLDCHSQEDSEIPQIDISMLMPYYPGPFFPLCGIRIEVKANGQTDSEYTPFDILFRARSFPIFLEEAEPFRSIGWTQAKLLPQKLSNPYRIQTASEYQMRMAFPYLTAGLHIEAQARRITNRGLEKAFHGNKGM